VHPGTDAKAGARTFLSAAASKRDMALDKIGLAERLELAADRNVRAPPAVFECALAEIAPAPDFGMA